jgi:uncharacterized protein
MSSVRKNIVVDTSSLVAACLYPERFPAEILRQLLRNFQLVASTQTQFELQSVLQRPKFDRWQPPERRMNWLALLTENMVLHTPDQHFTDCTDPKDNMFLDLAVAANALAIVCSDDHLLSLHPFITLSVRIEILTLRQFQAGYLQN